MAFVNRVTLYKAATKSMGESDTVSLRGIASTLGGLYRYLLGVRITVSGSMTQSAATAALAKELLMGILSSVQCSFAGRTLFAQARTSLDQFVENLMGGIGGNNTGLYVSADLTNNTNAQTYKQRIILPFAEEWYRTRKLDDESIAGMVPVGALGDGANIQYSIVADGTAFGDWGQTSQTYITVLIEADILNTAKRYLCVCPESEYYDVSASQNPFATAAKRNSAISLCGIYDKDGAFTTPTGEVSVKVGSHLLFDQVTGAQITDHNVGVRSNYALSACNTVYDDGVLVLIDPVCRRVPRNMPVGDKPREGVSIEVVNAHAQNSSGTNRYLIRRLVNPDAALEAAFLAAVGLSGAVSRDRLYLNDRPLASYPEDEIIGSAAEVR